MVMFRFKSLCDVFFHNKQSIFINYNLIKKYSLINSSKIVYTYNMNTVYMKYLPNETQFQLTFHLQCEAYNLNRIFNFSRNIVESIDVCLDRIRTNVQKEIQKKNRKSKLKSKKEELSKQSTDIILEKDSIYFLKNNEKIVGSNKKFIDILDELNNYKLNIIDQEYIVTLNSPWVNLLLLPTSLIVGCITYPSKLELLFANANDSNFKWFRGSNQILTGNNTDIIWEHVGDQFYYDITEQDIDRYLKVQCTPINGEQIGPPIEAISSCIVKCGPSTFPFQQRHKYTESKLNNGQFRIVTYNLLADLYCDTEYAKEVLFSYCPEHARNIDYRKQLFIKELIGYQSDIICLQEVDKRIFDYDLKHIFSRLNFEGNFKAKRDTAEGLAIFYDLKRFSLVKEFGINIGEVISQPIFNEIWKKIETHEKLVKRISERSTAVQVIVLRSIENDKYLIVANTHLYFHPDADNIRLLQMGFAMIYVQHIYDTIKSEYNLNTDNLSILFCGDFNSVPECGIYKLITEKDVPEDFIDFRSNENEPVTNVALTQPFNMRSSYTDFTVTNYTVEFSAWLDYIFYQTDNLEVLQNVPIPSEDILKNNIAIPSIVFPSDHLALISDFQWIK